MKQANKRILVIHGPNLNTLGTREPQLYGTIRLRTINQRLKRLGKTLGWAVDCRQSNQEGKIVDLIQWANRRCAGILLNAAGYTHTSVTIRDAVSTVKIPVIEVHLSNIFSREEFRQTSLIAGVSAGQIVGFGSHSYLLGLLALISLVQKNGASTTGLPFVISHERFQNIAGRK